MKNDNDEPLVFTGFGIRLIAECNGRAFLASGSSGVFTAYRWSEASKQLKELRQHGVGLKRGSRVVRVELREVPARPRKAGGSR